MKVRQSASLMAGVCTLCVAASGSVTPLPAAAAAAPEGKSPVVARPYQLDAATTPLDTIVSLPYQSLITVLQAVAGVAGGADGLGGNGSKSLQALPALVYAAITQPTATNNLETLAAALQTALGTEATALQNLTTLPQRLLAPLTGLTGLSANTVTTTSKVTPALGTAAVTTTPLDTIVSLPYQNLITVLQAVAGVAGGADGLGGNGSKSLQALPALVYAAVTQPTATNNLETLPAAFETALGTEATALKNLATLPQRLVTTDLAASSGTSSLAANKTASPLALTSAIAPVVKKAHAIATPLRVNNLLDPRANDVTKGASKDVTTNVDRSSTTPKVKKSNDNPVANAVKTITKAAKDSGYVGKHRADAKSDGAKNGGSSDGGKDGGSTK